MPEKITSKQENRLSDLFRDAVRALGLTKDEAQEIISNGGTLQLEVRPILKKLAIADKRIGAAIAEFDLTVPADYNHDKQVDQFAKKVRKEKTTYHYNDALSSKNFANATNKLEAGKTYTVKIFPIMSAISSEACLAFLRKQNAILAGAHGMTLVYNLHKDQLPKGKWSISFDEKEALWKDADGDLRVPYVFARADGDFEFNLDFFAGDWGAGHCLVCFCDK
ncbi:MAG: hypothetical protein JWM92_132 [Candidatus Nomurabacteria bacterium]|nr:hypothetical protein [Candidatus Nomurabacteria bacterium]